MNVLRKIDNNIEEYIMGILLIGIASIMFIQIFARLFGSSLSWAEEFCRYLYIWSVFLSISYTIKKKIILKVDVLINFLPTSLRNLTEVLLHLINIAFFSFLGYYSIKTIEGVRASLQTSPAMEIPMYLVYLIIPIGFFLACFRSAQHLIVMFQIFKNDTTDDHGSE